MGIMSVLWGSLSLVKSKYLETDNPAAHIKVLDYLLIIHGGKSTLFLLWISLYSVFHTIYSLLYPWWRCDSDWYYSSKLT